MLDQLLRMIMGPPGNQKLFEQMAKQARSAPRLQGEMPGPPSKQLAVALKTLLGGKTPLMTRVTAQPFASSGIDFEKAVEAIRAAKAKPNLEDIVKQLRTGNFRYITERTQK